MRLIDYFDRGADLFPDRHCLHDGTKGWTYKEVGGQIHRVADGLLAVVELKPGVTASADELIHLAKDRLGGVKAPNSVDFIAALPCSPVGKVLKKNLREPHWSGRERKI